MTAGLRAARLEGLVAEIGAGAAAREPILRLDAVSKRFGDLAAVAEINLTIRDGEFFTIVGPSGSGKTTLLRMLAGLERPSGGAILLRGKDISNVPPARRPTCLVFQSLALFPHMTVGENIEYALRMRGVAAAPRRERALALMAQMRLPEGYYRRPVTQCSGGERQRVALARALAADPEMLFFDEPLSALDYRLRKTLEKELKDLQRSTGKTFVYITHSLEEAMVMSDRIGVMRAGRMVQVGTPEDIYLRPADRFTAEFMGEVNAFSVRRRPDGLFAAEGLAHPIRLPEGAPAICHAIVRPESLRLLRGAEAADNVLEGVLVNDYAIGSRLQYRIEAEGKTFVAEAQRAADMPAPRPGAPVRFGWDTAAAILVAS
jgi:spermidine/putrescine transport system ATP-binding protein